MILEKIELRNFKCFKDVDINKPINSFNLLVGENGSGKTSLLEAIIYCLYGTVPRGKLGLLLSKGDSSVFAVSMYLSSGSDKYKITRVTSMGVRRNNASTVLVVQENDEDIVAKGIADSQKYINHTIMGMDYKQFTQSCLYGYNHKSFMALSNAEKLKFLEQLFRTSWGEFSDKAHRKMTHYEFEVNKAEARKNEALLTQADAQRKINELKKQVPKTWNHDEDELRDKYQRLEDQYRDMESKMSIAQANVRNAQQRLDEVDGLESLRTCPTCGTKVTRSHFKKHKEQFERERDKNIKLVRRHSLKSQELYAQVQEAQENYRLHSEIRSQIRSLEELRDESKQREVSATIALERSQSQVTHFKALKRAVSKESWLRYTVTRGLLENLSFRTNLYLREMNVPMVLSLTVDTKKWGIDNYILRHKQGLVYESLSRGEQKRVDLAIALSIRDITQEQSESSSQKFLSLLFFDEVLDGLDIEGVQSAVEVLKTFTKEGEYLFMTSHDLRITSVMPDDYIEFPLKESDNEENREQSQEHG